MTDPLTLLQFPYSHYNEKARWALDWKRLPHRRVSLLPGPHGPQILRLTGLTTTPVLRIGDRVVAGSAAIVEALEALVPDPPLFPADPALRARATEVVVHFDEEVGPRVRRALFEVMLDDPGYVCRLFAGERSAPVRALYRAAFPAIGLVMRRNMGVRPAAVAEALEGIRRALDLVATESKATGYLVGDRFGVADLTAASLLAPLVDLPHPDMARPRPMPDEVAAFLEEWSEHPGVEWVREQYRRHRPDRSA